MKGPVYRGKKGNDAYVYSYVAAHFDLFSGPKTLTTELLYADVEYDEIFFDDEDGDFVLDVSDRCPETPDMPLVPIKMQSRSRRLQGATGQ